MPGVRRASTYLFALRPREADAVRLSVDFVDERLDARLRSALEALRGRPRSPASRSRGDSRLASRGSRDAPAKVERGSRSLNGL
jgi:hypothetical protein